MSRSADYTIQGFLYQFNKTLLEIMAAPDDSEITIEGIIEDIEIVSNGHTNAIQCKYHETVNNYTLSSIYEPVLQMMDHYHKTQSGSIKYVLFAHFPNTTTIQLTSADIGDILKSNDKGLKKYIERLYGKVNIDGFLSVFTIEIGQQFDALVKTIHDKLVAPGLSEIDIATITYPNAIHIIGELSRKHDVSDRKITRKDLLARLSTIKSTAISHWTLSLKSRSELLKHRRKQLQVNLKINSRLRYFIVHADSLSDFDEQIVLFIKGYIDKYHFKPAHISTPIFCINAQDNVFKDIQLRLLKKDIIANDGMVADVFHEDRFFRDPIITKDQREFMLRVIRWEPNGIILNKRKADDIFILGEGGVHGLDNSDVNIEELATNSLNDVYYMMGLCDVID